ncbi:hypothetical protein BC939DRAFT_471549 [Gamsiella multidivaricata]|uniref:uncharacterized protein n=1 Tax=Gamsiella multidivaricata TaxID=101098 RepID=UPI0022200766|nr:uncharacterized protein BC939DRAFT_471549 [Gamsiella multidivaricata]KAI7815808.1 hypothetical protein BC939DRAFT_471549 [Gamsiella multidivaricata]
MLACTTISSTASKCVLVYLTLMVSLRPHIIVFYYVFVYDLFSLSETKLFLLLRGWVPIVLAVTNAS